MPVRVELTNRADRTITILAAGVPWTYHHAISFSVPGNADIANRLTVLDPPSVPDLTIRAGETAGGDVDLAQYLYSKQSDKSINELPGSYSVVAHAVALASTAKGDDDFARLELDSEPFSVVVADA